MSKLYASINADASRTEVTRRGHKTISAHVRGWNDGARIECHYTDAGVQIAVYRTSGSNGRGTSTLVASWTQGNPVTVTP